MFEIFAPLHLLPNSAKMITLTTHTISGKLRLLANKKKYIGPAKPVVVDDSPIYVDNIIASKKMLAKIVN